MSAHASITPATLFQFNQSIQNALVGSNAYDIDDSECENDVSHLMSAIVSFRDVQMKQHECDLRSLRNLEHLIASLTKSEIRASEWMEMNNTLIDIDTKLSTFLSEIDMIQNYYQNLPSTVEPYMQRLSILLTRKKVLELAISIEKSSQDLTTSLSSSVQDQHVEALSSFQDLVASIPDRFSYVRDVAMKRKEKLIEVYREGASSQLEAKLGEAGWPSIITTKQESGIVSSFEILLKLQYNTEPETEPKDKKMHEIWAIKVLSKSISTRFLYHFSRPESLTNEIVRPEWYTRYILDQMAQHHDFLTKVIGPTLQSYHKFLPCTDVVNLILRELIATCVSKVRKDLPVLLAGDRAIFCHTLDELLLFESALDSAYGYGEWSDIDRDFFLRCIDTFTDSEASIFAWAQADESNSLQILQACTTPSHVAALDGKLNEFAIWKAQEYEALEYLFDKNKLDVLVPPVAMTLVALLDYLCQRSMYMKSDECRYFYVTHVHYKLIDWFCMQCKRSFDSLKLQGAFNTSWKEVSWRLSVLCSILSSIDHVLHTLHQWEQSMFFIELTNRIKDSTASRTRIFRYHIEYTKSAITHVAKAASEAVMTREEAVAVRQAIIGPGAVIGPTAAFSAAYTAGSKTVLSLFGQSQNDNGTQGRPASDVSTNVVNVLPKKDSRGLDTNAASDVAIDDVLAHSIFEEKINDIESLHESMIAKTISGITTIVQQELVEYERSFLWKRNSTFCGTVSSEIARSISLCQRSLQLLLKKVPQRVFKHFWRSLANKLDTSLLDCLESLYEKISRHESVHEQQPTVPGTLTDAVRVPKKTPKNTALSDAACAQLVCDIDAWMSIWEFTSNTVIVLPRARAIQRLFLLERKKLEDIANIFANELESNDMDREVPEQITTMIEASGLLPLTIQQVHWLCMLRLQ